jgi:hypothetical protein
LVQQVCVVLHVADPGHVTWPKQVEAVGEQVANPPHVVVPSHVEFPGQVWPSAHVAVPGHVHEPSQEIV